MISGGYRCPLYDDDAAVTTTDPGSDQSTHQLDNAIASTLAPTSSFWLPLRHGGPRASRSSWRNARHLPHRRSRAGDRHLNCYGTQDNVLSRPLLRLLWRCAWRWRDADRGCVAERPPCGM